MNNNKKTFNILLCEELDRYVENLSLKKVKDKQSLNELFSMNITNFMKDIGSQEIEDDVELDSELWNWFLETINESMHNNNKEWLKLLKEQKLKILCYKFFTKKDLIELEKLEKHLKKQIRKFFTALQNYTDLEGFREKFSNLPSELLSNLVRYLFKISNDLDQKIKITKPEFKKRVKELFEERMKMVEKINLISKSYQPILDLSNLKELFDNGVFFEDNLINRGVNEYVSKLLNHKQASKKIKDIFSNTLVFDLKEQSQTSSAYINHIDSIKKETGQEFFTFKGFQVGNRFSNEIDVVKEKKTENKIIDKDSVFKEPKDSVNNIVSPWEKDSTNELEPGDMDSTSSSSNNSGSGGFSSGGDMMSGNTFGSDVDLKGEENSGELPTEDNGEDGDTPLPTDDQGFPVDFGSEETNPAAGNTENSPSNTNNKKTEEK